MNVKLAYNISSISGYNFWQVPKCGTTTVKHEILKRLKPEALQKIDEVCAWIHNIKEFTFLTPEQANSNENYNFTFIRNPRSRFESLFKDCCLHRNLIPNLYKQSPETLLSELYKAKFSTRPADGSNSFQNVHLRPISYFLKEFKGDIFNIDDLSCDKINRRKEKYNMSPEIKSHVDILWAEDFELLNQSKDIASFTRVLEKLS